MGEFCLSKINIKIFSSKPIPHLNEKNKGYYYTQTKDAEEELKDEEKQEDNCKKINNLKKKLKIKFPRNQR